MKDTVRTHAIVAVLAAAGLPAVGCDRAKRTAEVAEPPGPADVRWLRPAAEPPGEPVWGREGGLKVGLWPTSGPRGLIRIYAPYLGQHHPRMVNYIAVEPVVKGRRGQSELEKSARDKLPGLRMWTADTRAELDAGDRKVDARGRIETVDGVDTLAFFLATEPFRNGARPILQVIFRADRPYEVGFRLHAAPEGVRMDSCVLTATMGNYARLRRLWLRGQVIDARNVWPTFQPDPLGFAPWRAWGRDVLFHVGNELMVAATSDEPDPATAAYDADVPDHWRYIGRPATQYWRTADAPGAVVRVNGRTTYWGGVGKIPGGVSYENFELKVPFADGQEFWFGVSPAGPKSLGFDPGWAKDPKVGADSVR